MMNSKLKPPNRAEPNKLLLYYQCLLAVGAIAIFFTKLDVYLGQRDFISLFPIHWIALFFVASFPILLSIKSIINYFPRSILTWSAFYLAISCFSILVALPSVPGIPVETTIQDFETRILVIFSLLLMTVIFTTSNSWVILWTRRAILAATFINIFNNIYEFFHPLSFGFIQKIAGRSAGFYLNANESAMALVVGMILSISLINKNYRFLFSILVLIGIIFTFSRGGLLGWLLALIMLITTRIIPRKQILTGFIGVILVISFLTSQTNNLTYLTRVDGSDFLNEDTLTRIEWAKNPALSSDIDGNSRYKIALEAWNKFAQSPIIGSGISSSRDRNSSIQTENRGRYGERPHNIHLVNLVEHGFLGIFIFPTLLIAIIIKGKGKIKSIGIVFASYYMLAGALSHTILYDNYSLLSLALMASLTRQSYLIKKIK